MKPPFSNKEEYQQHIENGAAINAWAEHILAIIIPDWQTSNEVYEVWEEERINAEKLILDYTQDSENEQAWIPIACLWSEDWEKLNREAKEKGWRQWKAGHEKLLKEKAASEEADERAMLARLQEKYPVTALGIMAEAAD